MLCLRRAPVTPRSIREYVQVMRQRYAVLARPAKSQLLTEFCATTGYHRKVAIRALTRVVLCRKTRPNGEVAEPSR
jgi:hypothetical protein